MINESGLFSQTQDQIHPVVVQEGKPIESGLQIMMDKESPMLCGNNNSMNIVFS